MKNNLGNLNNMQSESKTEDKEKLHVNIKSKSKSPLRTSKNNDEGEYVDFTEIK